MDTQEYHRLSVIIPVYNEGDKISSTINGLKQIDDIEKIIVIDDGSSDNTFEEVKKNNVDCIKIDKNRGKGYAIKEGLNKIKSEYYIFIDGDLGHTSQEIESLINPVLRDGYDIAISRFKELDKKTGIGLVKKLAKFGVEFYTGNSLDSVLSGQRIYSKKALESIEYIPDRYGIEVAMTIQAIENGLSIKEVNVDMSHRVTGRDIKGFFHRGKQFKDIFFTLFFMYKRR
ncbi:glycosyltransferase family 2 protein [Clostridium sp. D2Q-11]|uniref:Glycosyltransferase family 2 protein n=1 Tax=Anaeromonas frigoriresistens TaxID=2683708 RepID=A0A942UVS7_9FIRM|nr:glycosyltransferase family 2 protein [Anaeromonas frigoriresistens]MBS4539973.1 glycosyltransferase family 2 protein [Anaeromonas frigoriresistens]